MNYQSIKPFIHEDIKKLLADSDKINYISNLSQWPVHVIFPDIFRENIKKFKDFFLKNDTEYQMFFAHKTNKSSEFLKVAESEWIWIDVASKNELIHALSQGFSWKTISCSWPKSKEFLFLSMKHNCLISIDSISELLEIINIYNSWIFPKQNILIRINDLTSSDRNISTKNTKFWISQKSLNTIYELLNENTFISFKWIHFHFDEHQHEIKAGSLENAIEILQSSYQLGFNPDIIDIWWGLRGRELNNKLDWKNYIDFLSESKKNWLDTHTWWNRWYGIHVNQRGWIEWRELVEKRYREINPQDFLKNVLNFKSNQWQLNESLQESMFQLMLEPGYSLALWCWFTILKVDSYKVLNNGDEAISLNGNIMSLSSKMWEYFTDPIHVSVHDEMKEADNDFYWYLFWNLCRDDDILMQRKVYFKNKPKNWDLILFMNTSSYISDFEDASPISQKQWIKVVAKKQWNNFKIYPDNHDL